MKGPKGVAVVGGGFSGIAMVETPATSPAVPSDSTVAEIVRAGPPMEMVAPFATSVPGRSSVHVCPAATMPSAGPIGPEAGLSSSSPPLPFGSSPAGELPVVGREALGTRATYGKVVGITAILSSPTDIWTLPIDILAPDETVDPPTMIPPPEAFAMPCPFKKVKALVAVADGICIALPPTTIPAEFCAMRIPFAVVSLLESDRWFSSMIMPPFGCAAIVCPAAVTCAAAEERLSVSGGGFGDGIESGVVGAFGFGSNRGS